MINRLTGAVFIFASAIRPAEFADTGGNCQKTYEKQ